MTALNIRAAQTSDDIPMGPFSEDDLRQQWNAQADEHNQWESLDSAEQLAWAQARAIGADRCARAALKAEPEGEGPTPTLDHVNLIGFAVGREPWATWLRKGGCLESAHCELSDLMLAAITRWGTPAPPAIPGAGTERRADRRCSKADLRFDALCGFRQPWRLRLGGARQLADARRSPKDRPRRPCQPGPPRRPTSARAGGGCGVSELPHADQRRNEGPEP